MLGCDVIPFFVLIDGGEVGIGVFLARMLGFTAFYVRRATSVFSNHW